MQQIKFRGKCNDHNYVYGYVVKDKRSATGWYIVTEEEEKYVEVDPNSISQFTGITSDGVEIYENDQPDDIKPKVFYIQHNDTFTGKINISNLICSAKSLVDLEKKMRSLLKIMANYYSHTFEFHKTTHLTHRVSNSDILPFNSVSSK